MRYDDCELISDTSDSPRLKPCIHHLIIEEQPDGQSLGICQKCGKHKTFNPSYAYNKSIMRIKPAI